MIMAIAIQMVDFQKITNAPAYLKGDRLIAKKPVFRPNPGAKGKNKCDYPAS